jgi:hypothetical protein
MVHRLPWPAVVLIRDTSCGRSTARDLAEGFLGGKRIHLGPYPWYRGSTGCRILAVDYDERRSGDLCSLARDSGLGKREIDVSSRSMGGG